MTDPAFRLIVRKKVNGKVSTFYLSNGDRFTAEENATYMVSVHNVYNNYKDIDFAKYVELFANGLDFALTDVTEQTEKEIKSFETQLSMGKKVTWELGTYSIAKATKEDNKSRIRMTEALTVTEDTTYEVVITKDGKGIKDFRLIVRDKDENGKVTTQTLSNGEKLNAKVGHSYYITTQNVYANHLDWTFQTYYEKMCGIEDENGNTELYVFDLK